MTICQVLKSKTKSLETMDPTTTATGESTYNGEGSLALLLQSCSSITNTALSSSTIGNRAHLSEKISDIKDTLLQGKTQALWLDRQILDYRTALERRHRSQQRIRNKRDLDDVRERNLHSSKRPSQQIYLLQDSLFDESERIQRCQMLQSRIHMTAIAKKMMSSSEEIDPNVQLLHKEVLRSRDKQVYLALKKLNRLDKLKFELQSASEECKQLQQKNRELWKENHGSVHDKHCNAPLPSDTEREEEQPSARLASENLILRRALLDIIVGSGVDWYRDKRVWTTMIKLEAP